MECLLCSFPEDNYGSGTQCSIEESTVEKKNKSLRELGDITGVKYANSLCQVLNLPSSTFEDYFLNPAIRFCFSCTDLVGSIARLLEQLEAIQLQISSSKNEIHHRLLQCQSPDEGGPSTSANPTFPASIPPIHFSSEILRQEIIRSKEIYFTF